MSVTSVLEKTGEVITACLSPFKALAKTEITNWWSANFVNWIFVLIAMFGFVFVLSQIHKYEKDGTIDYKEE
jgi:hypothetical protein